MPQFGYFHYNILSSIFFFKMIAQLWQKAITKASSQPNKQNQHTNMLLPNQLGGKILDKEIECEDETASKDTVVELMELYASAIEYYENIGCDKYRHFQTRIQNLLVKPLVQSILQGKSPALSCKKDAIERKQRQASVNSKEEANIMLLTSQKLAKSKTKQLHRIIKDQERALESRIQRRKSNSYMSSRGSVSDLENLELQLQNIKIQKKQVKERPIVFTDIKNRPSKKVFI